MEILAVSLKSNYDIDIDEMFVYRDWLCCSTFWLWFWSLSRPKENLWGDDIQSMESRFARNAKPCNTLQFFEKNQQHRCLQNMTTKASKTTWTLGLSLMQ